MDVQKILKIENAKNVKTENDQSVNINKKRTLTVDDFSKYKNLQIKKVRVDSSESNKSAITTSPTQPISKLAPISVKNEIKPKVYVLPDVQSRVQGTSENKSLKDYSRTSKEKSPPKVLNAQLKPVKASNSPLNISPVRKIVKSYVCVLCHEKFTDLIKLQGHSKSCKASENMMTCVCGKKFISKAEMAVHVQVEHKQTKKYICKKCKKIFLSPRSLSTHLLNAHPLENSVMKNAYLCCSLVFNDIESFQKHRKSTACKKVNVKELIET
jgi:TfoX/Sxy family transcriptional regulator of competence genes